VDQAGRSAGGCIGTLLTVPEVARVTKRSRSGVYRLFDRGLKSFLLGGTRVVEEAALADFLDECKKATA
jgi:hypothetical protein